MSNLINLENVSKSWGLKTLLDSVSLGVQTGERIGIVGVNGGGKTTLLEVLTGIEAPDAGRVSHTSDLRMAVVTQRFDLDEDLNIGQAVVEPLGVHTYQWASNAKVREVLEGTGVAELGLDTRVGDLSGGERRRVNLAAALVQDLDLVVLDEPTNHLDVEGVQWLAEHLLARKIAVVVVTHDRWFLDTVATLTWEVHDGTVDVYEGGYNDWTFARAERARQADAIEQRRQNLARKELAWLRRGAPARTSKPRYRIEAAEALISNVPAPRDTVELMAFSRQRQGKIVIELEDARVETPDGRMLVDHLTWRLAPGERIGLVGVNGSARRRCCARSPGSTRWPPAGAWRAKPPASGGCARNWTISTPPAASSTQSRTWPTTSSWGTRKFPPPSSPSASGSRRSASARPSATSPAVSAAACSSPACSWASRTFCFSTSPPTTWTSTRSRNSRTCSTAGPARSW